MRRFQAVAVGLAAIAAGAATMVIELAGAQALAPGFGTGLNTWCATITVALGALACGYALGGVAADLKDGAATSWLLPGVLALAGAFTAADALLWRPVVYGLAGTGPRLGAVLAAAALFLPPFIALGAVYPLAVRAMTRSLQEVGRRSGWMSALSAGGSVLGAALAGFVLVPCLALEMVFAGCAAGLLLTAGLVLAALARKRFLGLPLAALGACALLAGGASLEEDVLERRGSLFGPLVISEFGAVRYMIVSDSVQGAALREDLGRSYLPHVRVAAGALRDNLAPGRSVLVIGLGAGHMPRALDIFKCQTVEIDPAVVASAERWFAFDVRSCPVKVADGRSFLLGDRRRHAAIVLDALRGSEFPFHLLSEEFFELTASRLDSDGILLVNFQGYLYGPGERLGRSLEKTLREVFPRVELYVQEQSGDYAAVVFAAHRRAEGVEWPLCHGYEVRETLLDGGPAAVVTDSRNPVALWCAWARSRAANSKGEIR